MTATSLAPAAFQAGYLTGGGQPGDLGPRGPAPPDHRVPHPRCPAVEGPLGRPDVGRRGHRRGLRVLRDAARSRRPRGHPGRRVRPLPDHVDRLHGDPALPGDGASPAGSRTCVRRSTSSPTTPASRRSSSPSASVASSRPGRLRRPRGDHRRHAHGPGLLAAACRRRRAAGQHRARRVRCGRHPDHHRGQPHRHPLPGDRRVRRAPDPDPRGLRPAPARPHGRRPTRRAPDLADRGRRRPHLRDLPVGLRDLDLGRADRHHRLPRRPCRRRALPARCGSPPVATRHSRRPEHRARARVRHGRRAPRSSGSVGDAGTRRRLRRVRRGAGRAGPTA
jgi:hypothetical protein